MKKHLVLIILIAVFLILSAVFIVLIKTGKITNLAANNNATLALNPPSGNYTTGTSFPVDVIVNTGSQPTSGVDLFLNYNTQDLSVQDADTVATGIQIKNRALYSQVLYNNVDTAAGKIKFIATLNGGETAINTVSGIVATITFNVLQKKANSPVTFDFTVGTTGTGSDVVLAGGTTGTNILGSVTNGSYNLVPPAVPTTVTFQLEGHPANSATTNTILEVKKANSINTDPLLFQKADLATDVSGTGTLTITDVPAGNYDFRINVGHWLTKVLVNQPLANPMTLNFTTLKAGDLLVDNQINGGDFTYLKQKILTSDTVADINADGRVDAVDFSFIYNNWGSNGQ